MVVRSLTTSRDAAFAQNMGRVEASCGSAVQIISYLGHPADESAVATLTPTAAEANYLFIYACLSGDG